MGAIACQQRIFLINRNGHAGAALLILASSSSQPHMIQIYNSCYNTPDRTPLLCLDLLQLLLDVCRIRAPQLQIASPLQLGRRINTRIQHTLDLALIFRSFCCERHVCAQNGLRCLECVPDGKELEEPLAILVYGVSLPSLALVVCFGLAAEGRDAVDRLLRYVSDPCKVFSIWQAYSEVVLLECMDKAIGECLDDLDLDLSAMLLRHNGRQFGWYGNDERLAPPISLRHLCALGQHCVVLLFLHQFHDLSRKTQRLDRLFHVPVRLRSAVVRTFEGPHRDIVIAQSQPCRLDSLQRLQYQVVVTTFVQLSHNQLLPFGLDGNAGAVEAFQNPDDVLPVRCRFTLVHDILQA